MATLLSPRGGISETDIAKCTALLTMVLTPSNGDLQQNCSRLSEHGVAETEEGATPGRFPQVAGIQFSFDATQAPGDSCSVPSHS